MNDALQQLLRQPGIWQAGTGKASTGAIASGCAELDQALPGGGWPANALTELLHDQYGVGELRLFMPALARLSRSGRWIALIAPPHIPYAPALAAQGVDLSRILLVHPRRDHDTLWAVQQALRSGTCAAVLCWPQAINERQLRRLQLAAETGRTLGILFRREEASRQSSPAALRLRLRQDAQGTVLSILKCRAGIPGQQLRLDLGNPRTRSLPMAQDRPPRPAVEQPERRRNATAVVRIARSRAGTGKFHPLPQMNLPLGTDSNEPAGHHPPRPIRQ